MALANRFIVKKCCSLCHFLYITILQGDSESIGIFLFQAKMMTARPNIKKHVNVYQKYKLLLELTNDNLALRLFSNQQSNIYYYGIYQYNTLPGLFRAFFVNLQEVYEQFQAITQEKFCFDIQSYEIKQKVKLSAKTIQFSIKLQAVVMEDQANFQIENVLLLNQNKLLASLIDQKEKELQTYKVKTERLDYLLKKYQMENVDQLEHFVKQVVRYADSLFFNRKNKPNRDISEIQTSRQTSSQSLKRDNQTLWGPPTVKFFKNNEGKHQKLESRQNQLYSFFPSEGSRDYQKFFFGENCRLRLVQSCKPNEDFYIMRANTSTNVAGRTVLGLKLIKQFKQSKGIIIGLKKNENEEEIDKNIDIDSISYNLKTGILTNNIEGRNQTDAMMPIGKDQRLHLLLDIANQEFQCYRNDTLIKTLKLSSNLLDQLMIPYVKMSVAGEEIEFQ